MNQLVTKGIVLGRTDYGEADRIVTMLTPDQGKLRLMARGVRKIKSKLAGGIELFSVSEITFIRGRGDISTLTSSRMAAHYGEIVKDVERVQLGYELIKLLNRITEDSPESDYFELLQQAFEALNDSKISPALINLWFLAQLLRLGGHAPNLATDTAGLKLEATKNYNFDFSAMAFAPGSKANFTASDIKFLRLLFSGNQPKTLAKVSEVQSLAQNSMPLVRNAASMNLYP